MPSNTSSMTEIVIRLNKLAHELWGPERAEAAGPNIEEAASYVWIIAQYPLANDEAPLFHPPSTV